MKYLVHDEIGRPEEVLRLAEAEPRDPGPGEVRARVLAAPVHPSDLLRMAGRYGAEARLPATPGTEAAARIEEVGAGIDHVAPGDLALILPKSGAWQSEITLPGDEVIAAPGGDPEQVAMAAANPISAWLLLRSFVALAPGDWFLQSAANSAIGQYIAQLGREMGFRSVNVVRREGLAGMIRAKGGDVVLVDGPDLGARIAEATGGAALRLALDGVAGDTAGRLLDALSEGGTLVSYGAMSNQPITLEPTAAIYGEKAIRGFWLMRWFRNTDRAERDAAFAELLPLVARGDLHADVEARFPLERFAEALALARTKRRGGKVLFVP